MHQPCLNPEIPESRQICLNKYFDSLSLFSVFQRAFGKSSIIMRPFAESSSVNCEVEVRLTRLLTVIPLQKD